MLHRISHRLLRHRRARPWQPALLAALLTGCSMLAPVPDGIHHYYTLTAASTPVSAPARGALTLAIAMPTARPGFDRPRMAYSLRHGELAFFSHSRWIDTPARMLAPLLVRALSHGGDFRAVVATPGAARADFRLDTDIHRLVQDFTTRPSQMRIDLRVQLTNVASGEIVATHVFAASEPTPEATPYGGVRAADRALQRLLPRIAAFCAIAAHSQRAAKPINARASPPL